MARSIVSRGVLLDLPAAKDVDKLELRAKLPERALATIKELIEEKFGLGIMSAIDFTMSVEKQPDPKGDRYLNTFPYLGLPKDGFDTPSS